MKGRIENDGGYNPLLPKIGFRCSFTDDWADSRLSCVPLQRLDEDIVYNAVSCCGPKCQNTEPGPPLQRRGEKGQIKSFMKPKFNVGVLKREKLRPIGNKIDRAGTVQAGKTNLYFVSRTLTDKTRQYYWLLPPDTSWSICHTTDTWYLAKSHNTFTMYAMTCSTVVYFCLCSKSTAALTET